MNNYVTLNPGDKFLVDGDEKEVHHREIQHRGNSKTGFLSPCTKVVFTDGTVRFADSTPEGVGGWDESLNGVFVFGYEPVGKSPLRENDLLRFFPGRGFRKA